MATVSHTIYSRYDPQERERNKLESSDPQALEDSDTWQEEAKLASRHRRRPPPHFVPASSSSAVATQGSSRVANQDRVSLGNELSDWYRTLSGGQSTTQSSCSTTPSITRNNSSPSLTKPSEKKTSQWFIMKAIQSEPSSARSTPPPSLADILARDPPPLPMEGRYKPPVWLELGPSNKGFAMLQRSGWNEGEALGPDVIRRPSDLPRLDRKGKQREEYVKREVWELQSEEHPDVSELREVAVIDLTLSDSDSDTIDDSGSNAGKGVFEEHQISGNPSFNPTLSSAHGGTALLTPLATVLKSDRLGIGLKAKTVGPYKASRKRVTHNAAAMAAHIRSAEASRRKKKKYGNGRKGYEKLRKHEEAERKGLLAYINS